MKRFVLDKVAFFEKTYVTSDDAIKSLSHQIEMFVKDFNRLEKEMTLTDYYLNKVMPLTSFT